MPQSLQDKLRQKLAKKFGEAGVLSASDLAALGHIPFGYRRCWNDPSHVFKRYKKKRFCSRVCGYAYKNSYYAVLARFSSKLSQSPNGCIEFTGARDKDGYGLFHAFGKMWRAPKVALLLAYNFSDIAEGLEVLHRCDNPPCCNTDHLFLGTNTQNMEDRDAKGRQARGERHGSAKLTEDDVLEVWRLWDSGKYSKSGISCVLAIGRTSVENVLLGKNWRHVGHD